MVPEDELVLEVDHIEVKPEAIEAIDYNHLNPNIIYLDQCTEEIVSIIVIKHISVS